MTCDVAASQSVPVVVSEHDLFFLPKKNTVAFPLLFSAIIATCNKVAAVPGSADLAPFRSRKQRRSSC